MSPFREGVDFELHCFCGAMMRATLLGRLVPRITSQQHTSPFTILLPSSFLHSSSTTLDAKAYLAQHEISVSRAAPSPVFSFTESGLPDKLTEKLAKDFPSPTPIQAQGLPIVLGGENLVGIAQTGSGKTLAFLLPALAHLSSTAEDQGRGGGSKGPRALILAPTRELAKQIEEVAVQFRRLAGVKTVCCIGGESRFKQLQQYERGADLVIGTPGRINDFLESRDMSLEQCGFVVLDEADRMLDMGFEPQVRGILENVKEDRQTAMFSATWPEEVQVERSNHFCCEH